MKIKGKDIDCHVELIDNNIILRINEEGDIQFHGKALIGLQDILYDEVKEKYLLSILPQLFLKLYNKDLNRLYLKIRNKWESLGVIAPIKEVHPELKNYKDLTEIDWDHYHTLKESATWDALHEEEEKEDPKEPKIIKDGEDFIFKHPNDCTCPICKGDK